MSKHLKLKQEFQTTFAKHVGLFKAAVSTKTGHWKIKGFVDTDNQIYTISLDTKVLSKIMELLLFPKIAEFAKEQGFTIVPTAHQNFYPDVTFVDRHNNRYAVDLKSTYRTSPTQVNGMTLGAFTGYFRDRKSTKNIMFPYESYVGHFVLGLIYERSEIVDEQKFFNFVDIEKIPSVAKDFDFFVQEKFKIAIDRPGSGNTKNIGSVSNIADLSAGSGPFSKLGEDAFDDYWMNYLTEDMCRAEGLSKRPYKNLTEYLSFKSRSKPSK